MEEKQTEWEYIRANWVNGNREDVRNYLSTAKKQTILNCVREALENDHILSNGSTRSGDLQDLREILSHYFRYTKGEL